MSYDFGPTVHLKKTGRTAFGDVYEVHMTGHGCALDEHNPLAITEVHTEDGILSVCRACSAVWLKQWAQGSPT